MLQRCYLKNKTWQQQLLLQEQLLQQLSANGNGIDNLASNQGGDFTAATSSTKPHNNGSSAASLRGLGSDQTLVLMNGKRRHTVALVNIFGARNRGATGTDMNSLMIGLGQRVGLGTMSKRTAATLDALVEQEAGRADPLPEGGALRPEP